VYRTSPCFPLAATLCYISSPQDKLDFFSTPLLSCAALVFFFRHGFLFFLCQEMFELTSSLPPSLLSWPRVVDFFFLITLSVHPSWPRFCFFFFFFFQSPALKGLHPAVYLHAPENVTSADFSFPIATRKKAVVPFLLETCVFAVAPASPPLSRTDSEEWYESSTCLFPQPQVAFGLFFFSTDECNIL